MRGSGVPKVSVVLTVYKRTEFIGEALSAALSQTFGDFEIIVSDDSCSDEIKHICNGFSDPRVRYRNNGENVGVSANVRNALSEARGEYFSILNDDDVWEPGFLSELVAVLDSNPDVDLAFSDHWILVGKTVDVACSEENTRLYRGGLTGGVVGDLPRLVFEKNGVPMAMASLLRTRAVRLEWFVKEIVGAYDFWMSCMLAKEGAKAFYVPRRLTQYRVHAQMETARRSAWKNDNLVYIFEVMKGVDSFFPHVKSICLSKYAGALYRVGVDRLRFGLVPEGRSFLIRSLKERVRFKPFLWLIRSYLC